MLNASLDNPMISVLEDKHGGGIIGNRVRRRRGICLMKDDGNFGKNRST